MAHAGNLGNDGLARCILARLLGELQPPTELLDQPLDIHLMERERNRSRQKEHVAESEDYLNLARGCRPTSMRNLGLLRIPGRGFLSRLQPCANSLPTKRRD